MPGNQILRQKPHVTTEGAGQAVQVKRLIRKRIRRAGSGIDLVADVNAVMSVNVNERHRQDTRSSETRTESPAPPRTDAAGLDNRGREQS
jgi:hypothetical protein